MTTSAVLFALALLLSGGAASAHPAAPPPAPLAQTAPAHTGRNVRDRGGATLTLGDQGEHERDRTLTQRIRQAVVADEALSTTAKNVKILTSNGLVTLRGPVSAHEKARIEATAHQIAGGTHVESHLEINVQ